MAWGSVIYAMRSSVSAGTVLLCGLCLLVTGCPPQPLPVEQISFADAIYRVNQNIARIDRTILAQGVAASGKFVDDDGKEHPYSLSGVILVLKPRYLYMDLRHGLGETMVRAGSNGRRYWLWIKPEVDTLWWGKYEHLDKHDLETMPFRPDQLIEAMGLDELPEETLGAEGPMYRVEPEHDQLFFIKYTPEDQGYIAKEYWLDRRKPYLVRRIVFRDQEGRVQMQSSLSRHAPVERSEALVATRIVVEWPKDKAVMDLSIRSWKWREGVGPDSQAFEFPYDKGKEQLQVDRHHDQPSSQLAVRIE